ncbi:hypothetical protein PV779_33640 [Streptomyces sp. ID01-9D]|nr:hypothetical protein [Streptomyces sp. ID01-9D]
MGFGFAASPLGVLQTLADLRGCRASRLPAELAERLREPGRQVVRRGARGRLTERPDAPGAGRIAARSAPPQLAAANAS